MAKKPLVSKTALMHGICTLNIVSVYDKPNEHGVVINQLLFGETFLVLYKKNKLWIKIQTTYLGITGWVKTNQLQLIDEKKYKKLSVPSSKTLDIAYTAFNDDISKNIVLGSNLPLFDGISFSMPDGKYIYNGQATTNEGLEADAELITKIARRYLHAPELTGGRTPFGIDSGALIQNIFNFFNFSLPRLPHEQCTYGENVDFMEFVQEGDIAFCEVAENKISHAGIILSDRNVLHVYGSVRIDKIDHFGIFNTDIRRYTHKLRIVKRHLRKAETFTIHKKAYL